MAERSSAPSGRRGRHERGVALVELAIAVPLLFLLLFGIINYGLLYKDNLTVQSAARAGARVGAQQSTAPDADWQILQSVAAALSRIDNAKIGKVVVYRASDVDGNVPDACLASTDGVAGECNVYGEGDFSLDKASFVAAGNTRAHQWDAASRDASLSAADYLGIWIQVWHDDPTGVFHGQITSSRSVFRLSPVISQQDPTTTTLPTTTTAPPHAYTGKLEQTTCDSITGYALDSNYLGTTLAVDLTADGVPIGSVVAGDAHGAEGNHGFTMATPSFLQDGDIHWIHAFTANNTELFASPKKFACGGNDGRHDQLNCTTTGGWAVDYAHLDTPVNVDLYINGTYEATYPAGLFRQSIENLIGNGDHAFAIPLPSWMQNNLYQQYTVTVKIQNTSYWLPHPSINNVVSCGKPGGAFADVDCDSIHGWAADPSTPNTPVDIDIFIDGVFQTTITADDFAAGTIGNEMHGFTWALPPTIRNGPQMNHAIDIKFHNGPGAWYGWFGTHTGTCGVAPTTTTTSTTIKPTTTTSTTNVKPTTTTSTTSTSTTTSTTMTTVPST